jgi:hypothetical protein
MHGLEPLSTVECSRSSKHTSSVSADEAMDDEEDGSVSLLWSASQSFEGA